MSKVGLLYRCITAADDGTFNHLVSEALSKGWQLYGNSTLAFDPSTQRMICGQSMVKEVPGLTYDARLDISKL